MKRFLGIIILGLFLAGNVYPMALKLTDTNEASFSLKSKAGVIYSIKREQDNWDPCALFEVIKWKGISVNGGWAYEKEIIGSVMFDVMSVVPAEFNQIPGLVCEIGPYIGYDFETEEVDYGCSAVLISVQF